MAEYYYKVMGDAVGPVSGAEIRQLVARGTITGGTEIRRGDGEWQPAMRYAALFPQEAPPPSSGGPTAVQPRPQQARPPVLPPELPESDVAGEPEERLPERQTRPEPKRPEGFHTVSRAFRPLYLPWFLSLWSVLAMGLAVLAFTAPADEVLAAFLQLAVFCVLMHAMKRIREAIEIASDRHAKQLERLITLQQQDSEDRSPASLVGRDGHVVEP